MIDEAKNKIDILDYIKSTSSSTIKREGSSTYRVIPCPLCGTGDHFTVNTDKNFFNSWGACGSLVQGGSIIDYIMAIDGVETAAAIEKVKQIAGIEDKGYRENHRHHDKREKDQPAQLQPVKDYTVLIEEAAKNKCQYYYDRGLTDDTIKKYRLGYLPEGGPYGSAFKYVLPITKHYVIFRSDNENDRYRNTKGTTEILNSDYLQDPSLTGTFIFITEGLFDALSFEEVGANAISLNSTSSADKFVEHVKRNADRLKSKIFILALDNDQAGMKTSPQIQSELRATELTVVEFNLPKTYKDTNEYLKASRSEFKRYVDSFIEKIKYKDAVSNYLLDYLKEIQVNKDKAIIKTGFEGLDKILGGGLYPGLYVLGAIPSLGKTTFIHQIADHIAASGEDVIFFSLEMSKFEMVSKSLSRLSLKEDPKNVLTSRQIQNAVVTEALDKAIKKYLSNAAKRMIIYEGNFDTGVQEIKQKIKDHIIFTEKKPVVIIDYLQVLNSPDFRLNDKQAVDKNVIELKRMSREFDIPLIVVSSLNRTNYVTPISFESFKESGAIEYGADCVIGLQLQVIHDFEDIKNPKVSEVREKINKAKSKEPRDIELVILKNRNSQAYATALYSYHPAYNYFSEVKESWKKV